MNLHLLLRQILPSLIIAAIALFAFAVHNHISKSPRPPGADPWHDERKSHLHFWASLFCFGVTFLFWDMVFAADSFVRALITPIIRAITG